MEAAAKAAQEEAKRKAEERKKATLKSSTTAPAQRHPASPIPAERCAIFSIDGHTRAVPARRTPNSIAKEVSHSDGSQITVRCFEFHGVRLPDPNPKLSVEEVRALYAQQYPGYRHGSHHRAGGSRRQAGLSLHPSHRHKGITNAPKHQKKGGDEAGGPGGA